MNTVQTEITDLVAQYCDDNNYTYEDQDVDDYEDIPSGAHVFKVFDEDDNEVEFIIDDEGEIDTFLQEDDLSDASRNLADEIIDFAYEAA